jgi:hypothetical protein
MPVLSTFADLSVRGNRNYQGNSNLSLGGWTLATNARANKTAATSVTTQSIVYKGDLMLVACAWDPTGASLPVTSSVTDTVGTTYTSQGLITAPATTASGTGLILQVYSGIIPGTVTNGTTITITWSWGTTNVTAKAINCVPFQNVRNVFTSAVTTGRATATTATLASGIANTGDLVVVVAGNEGNSVFNGASDTTRGSWVPVTNTLGIASSGGGAATNQAIGIQYKIVTGQGTQTASWSGLNAGNTAMINLVYKAI